MRHALPFLLCTALLGGCASGPDDIAGTWINQPAIEAAADSGKLREAMLAYGPTLEWRFAPQRHTAWSSNGAEFGEGHLAPEGDAHWRVTFHGDYQQGFAVDGDELVQQPSASAPEQRFSLAETAADGLPGQAFEQALYAALLGGDWEIREGAGQQGRVRFHPDGRVEGLPGVERYALCLAGDCAERSEEQEIIWLQNAEQGREWLFQLADDELSIYTADNQALHSDEPQYRPGRRAWLLERD
ncbi:MAG TPA: hypothetical protein VIO83_10835 [Pseudomonas sp.]